MRALRERIAQRREGVLGPAGDQDALAALRAASDVYGIPLGGASAAGRLIAPLRRALRRLLAPVLARQVEYNTANAALLAALARELDVLADQQARALDAVAALQADVAALARAVRELRER
jgi:hypothetical protein